MCENLIVQGDTQVTVHKKVKMKEKKIVPVRHIRTQAKNKNYKYKRQDLDQFVNLQTNTRSARQQLITNFMKNLFHNKISYINQENEKAESLIEKIKDHVKISNLPGRLKAKMLSYLLKITTKCRYLTFMFVLNKERQEHECLNETWKLIYNEMYTRCKSYNQEYMHIKSSNREWLQLLREQIRIFPLIQKCNDIQTAQKQLKEQIYRNTKSLPKFLKTLKKNSTCYFSNSKK